VNKLLYLNWACALNVSFVTNPVKDGPDISHVVPVTALCIMVPHFQYLMKICMHIYCAPLGGWGYHF
jgi:hypothetical protein